MMRQWLTFLRAQIARIQPTPRERGLLAIGATVLVIAALATSYDWTIAAYQRAEDALEQRLRAEREDAAFHDARTRERIGHAAWQVWTWSVVEPSDSIAQLRMIGELEDIARSAGIGDAVVQPVEAREAAPAGPNGFRTMDLRLSGSFDWRSFEALMSAFQQADTSITPVAVDVSAPDGLSRFVLTVRVAYLPEPTT